LFDMKGNKEKDTKSTKSKKIKKPKKKSSKSPLIIDLSKDLKK